MTASSSKIRFVLNTLVPEVEALANTAKALEGVAGDLVSEAPATKLSEAAAILHAGVIQVSTQVIRVAIAAERLAMETRALSQTEEAHEP